MCFATIFATQYPDVLYYKKLPIPDQTAPPLITKTDDFLTRNSREET